MGFFDAWRRTQQPALPAPTTAIDAAPAQQQAKPESWWRKRLDSLQNLITGLGVNGRDRRMGYSVYQRQPLVLSQQYFLYQQSWKARRAVEATPRHAIRAWIDVTVPDNPEASIALQKALERFRKPLRTGGIWANLTGGGLVAMIIDDGREPTEPLDLARVRGIRSVRCYDRWFAYPCAWNDDPADWHFGEPYAYSIFGNATNSPSASQAIMSIHASRALRFDGPLLPTLLRQANVGWNSSLLEYCWDAIQDHQQGLDSGAKALTAYSQLFISRVGFDQDVVAPGGETASDIRLSILSQQLATGGVAMLDQADKIETISQRMTGFDAVLDRLGDELAGAFEVPRCILYGQAGGTSRAGADTDVRTFYDNCREWSGDNLVPVIRQLVGILAATPELKKFGINADTVEIEPRSLWELTDKERAEIMDLRSRSLVALNGTGTLTVEQTHRAAVEILHDDLGTEVDDEFVAGATGEIPDDGTRQTPPDPDPSKQGGGALPPLNGLTYLGMPSIPGPDIGPGG